MQTATRTTTEAAGRAGLAARGALYCLLALVAIGVATGTRDGEVEGQGALELLADQPAGAVLLVALAVGFLAYAGWRALRAVREDGAVDRLRNAGAAVVHLGLLASTIRTLTKGDAGSDQDEQARSWTARLLESGLGRAAVVAVGVGAVLAALWLVAEARKGAHERHLDEGRMRPWQRRWFPRLGAAGRLAQAAVAALVGAFLVQAALTSDPGKAAGIDGALHRVPPLLLGLVALGLLAYGLWSFVEARWRSTADVTC